MPYTWYWSCKSITVNWSTIIKVISDSKILTLIQYIYPTCISLEENGVFLPRELKVTKYGNLKRDQMEITGFQLISIGFPIGNLGFSIRNSALIVWYRSHNYKEIEIHFSMNKIIYTVFPVMNLAFSGREWHYHAGKQGDREFKNQNDHWVKSKTLVSHSHPILSFGDLMTMT